MVRAAFGVGNHFCHKMPLPLFFRHPSARPRALRRASGIAPLGFPLCGNSYPEGRFIQGL